MSIFWNVESEDSFEIKTDKACIYSLRQQKKIFQELYTLDKTQQWLRECCREEENPIFVVGYRMLLNARLVKKKLQQSFNGRNSSNFFCYNSWYI